MRTVMQGSRMNRRAFVNWATLTVALILGTVQWASASDVTLFASPFPDKQCMGSPGHLGTDNIPDTSSRGSTIVDIAALGKRPSEAPLAWIYTTFDHHLWVQANVENRSTLLRVFGSSVLGRKLASVPIIRDGTRPIFVNGLQKQQFLTALKAQGYVRLQCFSRTLSSRYL